jgi:hypothetical protein
VPQTLSLPLIICVCNHERLFSRKYSYHDFVNGHVPISLTTMSRSLRHMYKDPTNRTHDLPIVRPSSSTAPPIYSCLSYQALRHESRLLFTNEPRRRHLHICILEDLDPDSLTSKLGTAINIPSNLDGSSPAGPAPVVPSILKASPFLLSCCHLFTSRVESDWQMSMC